MGEVCFRSRCRALPLRWLRPSLRGGGPDRTGRLFAALIRIVRSMEESPHGLFPCPRPLRTGTAKSCPALMRRPRGAATTVACVSASALARTLLTPTPTLSVSRQRRAVRRLCAAPAERRHSRLRERKRFSANPTHPHHNPHRIKAAKSRPRFMFGRIGFGPPWSRPTGHRHSPCQRGPRFRRGECGAMTKRGGESGDKFFGIIFGEDFEGK